jgi:hypothetical protein
VADETEDRLSRKRSKLEAALKALRDRERERDLKRYAIVGRAVLSHASRDPAYREGLTAVLDAELHKSSERELFGLPPSGSTGRQRRRVLVEVGPETPPGYSGLTDEPAPSVSEAQG